MPEFTEPKEHVHPQWRRRSDAQAGGETPASPAPASADALPPYAELHALSNFTFLEGASHPEELVERAAALGYEALALTDRVSLAGIVRAHVAAKEKGLPLVVGSEIHIEDLSARIVLLAPDRPAYARLSRLITLGRRRAAKGSFRLFREDLTAHRKGLIAIAVPPAQVLLPDTPISVRRQFTEDLLFISRCFGPGAFLGITLDHRQCTDSVWARSEEMEAHAGLPLVALGGIEAHHPARRPLRDVLTAIRWNMKVEDLGRRLPQNLRWMRRREVLARLFARRPDVLTRSTAIARSCRFSLDALRYEYPREVRERDLRTLTYEGARERYPEGVPPEVERLLEHELALIEEMRYESYFLTVYDLVRFARHRGILCQGRGSAANSAVCYCLGITAVDPDRFDLLFERFISKDRQEPPDIDVDFEHERREEVIQYVYERYGRDRAALAATVITYRGKSAVRDVGRVLGLPAEQVDHLAKGLHYWDGKRLTKEQLEAAGLDPSDPRIQRVMQLAGEILGFPRHLSQHVGGMVITEGRLDELAPIENAAMEGRSVIQWDKDDLDALGLLKVDCLSLGMLTAISKAFRLLEEVRGRTWDLASIPAEVPAVYDMASRGDTVGVFQIESRAQMAMLPRFRPRCFYDLVIEVAIVRPGPIQGGMVHPYLRRRRGEEKVSYPSQALRSVLEKTLGVPIFQEQVMKLAVVAAGFTPGEADQLRRAMGAWRRPGLIDAFHEKLIRGMRQRGYEDDFAEAVFQQIRGFGEYGFPESHAASFALLTYVSLWLKRFEPAAFVCALLNSLPMGFYGPSQLIADARRHGVLVLPVDVLASSFDATLERPEGGNFEDEDRGSRSLPPSSWGRGGPALRLGFRSLQGFPRAVAERLIQAREAAPFRSVDDCRRRAGLDRRAARILAEAGALRVLEEHRRGAVWEAAFPLESHPLVQEGYGPPPRFPPVSPIEEVLADYRNMGLSLKAHPMALLRGELRAKGILGSREFADAPKGSIVAVAGIAICRQRPATASGVMFITLEDEDGFLNAIVRRKDQERFRAPLQGGPLLLLKGTVERSEGTRHLLTGFIEDWSHLIQGLVHKSRDFR